MRVNKLSSLELLELFEKLICEEQQTINVATKKYKKLLSDIEDVRNEIAKRLERTSEV